MTHVLIRRASTILVKSTDHLRFATAQKILMDSIARLTLALVKFVEMEEFAISILFYELLLVSVKMVSAAKTAIYEWIQN